MAVTDLTNTTWRFNVSGCNPVRTDQSAEASLSGAFIDPAAGTFSSIWCPVQQYGDVAVSISITNDANSVMFMYLKTTDSVYINAGLQDGEGWYLGEIATQNITKMSTPPTIAITGGDNVTNSGVITWLEANAEQILPLDNKELVTYEVLDKFKEKMSQVAMTFDGGRWLSSVYYNASNACYYDDKIYIAKINNSGKLPTDTTYWAALVAYEGQEEEALMLGNEILADSRGKGFTCIGDEGGEIDPDVEFVLSDNKIIELSNGNIFYASRQ